MAKQGASAQSVRNGKDAGGLIADSEVKADSGEASRNMASQPAANARRAQKRLETHHARQVDTTALWEWRCGELGQAAWTRRILSSVPWQAARALAEALDHDAARVMGFGGKKFVLELRLHGRSNVFRFEISGFHVWRYVASRVN